MPRWSSDSRKHGTNGDDIDFALLVDGLEAEREQGITIDVAYRFFATPKRKFIVADTPGHEQYTRNMATGASTADLAVVLVDARQGVLRQTRRHSIIASLLGIRHIVLAVNKIDLVGFDRKVFERIAADYRDFRAEPRLRHDRADPDVGALWRQCHPAARSKTPWYSGPTLLEHLETVVVDEAGGDRPFRFPVQYVNRPNLDFRGFAGTVASGSVVARRRGRRRQIRQAVAGQAHRRAWRRSCRAPSKGRRSRWCSTTRSRSRAATCWCRPTARPHVADQFAANIVWFDEQAAAARPLLHPAHRDRPGQRHGHRPEIPHQRQRLRA